MVHQRLVFEVVLADLGELEGEGLALGEVLAVAAQARVHGMAARVDDPGVGQDQVQQPDVGEVVGHLVDEVARVTRAMQRGALQVFRPERMQVLGAQLAHALRIIEAVAAIAAQRRRDAAEVGQLAGAFDQAVARQYLLQKRGAGAWQPEDEDGGVVRMPGAGVRLPEIPR